MKYIVIKLGGSIAEELPASFFADLVTLQNKYQLQPVLVHGGGPKINEALLQHDIAVSFHQGLRISSPEVVDTAEMVLSGHINKLIVKKIIEGGGSGFGFSGVDGRCFTVQPVEEADKLGFVGEITAVNTDIIKVIAEAGHIPVISPISADAQGATYNVNADTAAGACAAALDAPVVFVSNIPGVMNRNDEESYVYPILSDQQIEQLIEDTVITDGMIPKVRAAVNCLNGNCKEAVILNGHKEHILISFAEKEDCGTKIVKEVPAYVNY